MPQFTNFHNDHIGHLNNNRQLLPPAIMEIKVDLTTGTPRYFREDPDNPCQRIPDGLMTKGRQDG